MKLKSQGSLHVLSLQHYLPVHDLNGEYQIPFPGTNELYIFNRYGQHISTKDLQTGKLYYTFVYSKNTSFGKLASVSDDSGNKVFFIREYSNVVRYLGTFIEKLQMKYSLWCMNVKYAKCNVQHYRSVR